MMIKNYTTRVPATKTMSEIHMILAKHGAQQIVSEFDNEGNPSGIQFAISGCVFRLPVRAEAVHKILNDQGVKADKKRADMVAWRNVKDWIDAQITIVETGQVQLDEVMLPYMLDRYGNTLFEKLPTLLLEEGDE